VADPRVPVTVTAAPAMANPVAMALPIPLVPPVTSTLAPVKSKLTEFIRASSIR
jgi:hypothetical protein